MKKIVTITLLIVFILSVSIFVFIFSNKNDTGKTEAVSNVTIQIKKMIIKAETAKSHSELERGLSGINSLDQNKGMLFYLSERKIAPFWMKDMKFSIDIVWIDDNKIVYIVENAPLPKGEDIPTYTPDRSATHVLEVNAGVIRKYSIETGDRVIIKE